MFITNSPAPSRINSAELRQRDVTVWEFAIFGYFPCIIRTVRTRSFNHKHKHRKMAIFCYFLSRFFLFLELGIFLFKLGKKHTFWHWEHDRISVIKTGQKKTWNIIKFTLFISYFSQKDTKNRKTSNQAFWYAASFAFYTSCARINGPTEYL